MKCLKMDNKAETYTGIGYGIGGLVWVVALIVLIWPPADLPGWMHFICFVIVVVPIIIIIGFILLVVIAALIGALD